VISLTKLSGQRFVLNAEKIRTVEETPDTMITLTTGDRVIVKETAREVVDRAVEYGRRLRTVLPPS
jgi:flagellar protein FlbD